MVEKETLKRAAFAGLFSVLIISTLTYLTYRTEYGLFLVASFGSSMVLILGYPGTPFAKGRNVFFGHIITSIAGVICYAILVTKFTIPIYVVIPLAVGLGIFFMILMNATHPPAGGNPIIVILGGHSIDFLINPIMSGCFIIILQAYIINNYILKRKYQI